MSDDADYLNTNILGSDDIGAQIAQDIIVSTVVTGLVENAVYGTVYHLGGKQALQAGFKRFDPIFTKGMIQKLQKTASQKVSGSITKKIGQTFAKRSAKAALSSLGKTAGTAAARSGAIAAGGCTLGPAGCAAGAAIGGMVFIADLAFTIFTTIQDIQDTSGILNIFHKAYVNELAADFREALNAGYAEMGYPDLMEEEVMFYPEYFIYDFDKDGNITIDPNNEWVQKYVEYRDEYMRKIGIPDGWESRLTGEALDPISDPVGARPPSKSSNASTLFSSISGSCLCILIILLFINRG
jgi:hypothetical protein